MKLGNKTGELPVMLTRGDSEGTGVLEAEDLARFEQVVLPHLDAAFNLARWLLRGRADAEDVAQEAMLRAFRFFGGFHGGEGGGPPLLLVLASSAVGR